MDVESNRKNLEQLTQCVESHALQTELWHQAAPPQGGF